MSIEEDAMLLAELVRDFTDRGFILTRFLKHGKLAYAVILRIGSQPLSLMAKAGNPGGAFRVHRFLFANSAGEDRPIVIGWKRGAYSRPKLMLFDSQRLREGDDGYGPIVNAPLTLAHPWLPSQDLGEAWARIKQLRKKPAPLDHWRTGATTTVIRRVDGPSSPPPSGIS